MITAARSDTAKVVTGPPSVVIDTAWLEEFVRGCQTVAGAAIDQSPDHLLTLLCATVARVPPTATGLDVAVARDILGRTAGHIIRMARLEDNADVSRAFIRVTCTPITGSWQSELLTLTRVCRETLRGDRDDVHDRQRADESNWYVRETLGFIERRFREPGCVLNAAAAAVRLTPSHLSRTLSRQTGQGFVAHLRRRRVEEARRLLNESVLRIKEIATAIGYDSRRQFERDFKRLCRTTPTSLRERKSGLSYDGHVRLAPTDRHSE
jgi:AraC-like DNA-binding protein